MSSSLAVIACAVLEDEVRHLINGLSYVRELIILPQGLHNELLRLRCELQAAVDRAEALLEVKVRLWAGVFWRGARSGLARRALDRRQ